MILRRCSAALGKATIVRCQQSVPETGRAGAKGAGQETEREGGGARAWRGGRRSSGAGAEREREREREPSPQRWIVQKAFVCIGPSLLIQVVCILGKGRHYLSNLFYYYYYYYHYWAPAQQRRGNPRCLHPAPLCIVGTVPTKRQAQRPAHVAAHAVDATDQLPGWVLIQRHAHATCTEATRMSSPSETAYRDDPLDAHVVCVCVCVCMCVCVCASRSSRSWRTVIVMQYVSTHNDHTYCLSLARWFVHNLSLPPSSPPPPPLSLQRSRAMQTVIIELHWTRRG